MFYYKQLNSVKAFLQHEYFILMLRILIIFEYFFNICLKKNLGIQNDSNDCNCLENIYNSQNAPTDIFDLNVNLIITK